MAEFDQALSALRTLRAVQSTAVRDDLGVLRHIYRLAPDRVERHPPRTGNEFTGEVLAGQDVSQLRTVAHGQSLAKFVGREICTSAI